MNEKQLIREVLTEAFDQNRSVNYVVKQDLRREERIQALVDYSYNICLKCGDVIVNENQTAVSLIDLPHNKKSPLFMIKQDFRLVAKSIGIQRLPLVLKRESAIKKYHPKHPFCHLWYIGVLKENQRKGIGTRLLQQIIEKYGKLSMPIYLETSMENNIAWYQNNDFQIYQELKDFGFTTYMMKKEP